MAFIRSVFLLVCIFGIIQDSSGSPGWGQTPYNQQAYQQNMFKNSLQAAGIGGGFALLDRIHQSVSSKNYHQSLRQRQLYAQQRQRMLRQQGFYVPSRGVLGTYPFLQRRQQPLRGLQQRYGVQSNQEPSNLGSNQPALTQVSSQVFNQLFEDNDIYKQASNLIAKWKTVDREQVVEQTNTEVEYSEKYKVYRSDGEVLKKARQELDGLLIQKQQSRNFAQQLEIFHRHVENAEATVNLLILELLNKEVTAAVPNIKKAFNAPAGAQVKENEEVPERQEGEDDDEYQYRIREIQQKRLHSGQHAQTSRVFNDAWLKTREKYLNNAGLLWDTFFVENRGAWNSQDSFLKEGYNAWQEGIQTNKILKKWIKCYENPSLCVA